MLGIARLAEPAARAVSRLRRDSAEVWIGDIVVVSSDVCIASHVQILICA
jgi:hypothetical protein